MGRASVKTTPTLGKGLWECILTRGKKRRRYQSFTGAKKGRGKIQRKPERGKIGRCKMKKGGSKRLEKKNAGRGGHLLGRSEKG